FKKIIFTLILATCLLFAFSITQVEAITLLPAPKNTTPGCAGSDCGDYTLNDFVELGVNVSEIILGLVGSLSLLMFIYGGISFLISAGNAESITKARKIIIAAVIGLAIVFTSYIIISFVLHGLGYKDWNTWYTTNKVATNNVSP
ncbi:MAG: hypothetical protein NTX66_01905, partial [Candidatus Falkowbacteria bacterium]|nr:hypothetical protein [Candidatus Falkowbacteria bacterium]